MKPVKNNHLRIGVVGMGLIGTQHIDAISRQPGAELAAVADSYLDDQRCDRLFVPGRYRDYREMMEKEDLDIIHNCTPNALHLAVSRAAFEHSLHVYGEKPLAGTLEEGESLCRLAEQSGLANAVNFNYRNNVMVWEMRERLAGGDAGRCFLIHGAYLQDWLMRETDFNWRLAQAEDGARSLSDIGSHWFDLVQFVTGAKITAVNASLITAHPVRYPASESEKGQARTAVEIRSDDAASVQLRMDSGLVATVMISQVSGGYKNAITLSVDCENYSMRWDQQKADRLVIGRQEGGEETLYADASILSVGAKSLASLPAGHATAWADALRNSVGEFYRAVRSSSYREGVHAYPTFADGLQIMLVVEACRLSNSRAQWVNVTTMAAPVLRPQRVNA